MNYYFVCFILAALLTTFHIFTWNKQYGIQFTLMYVFATISNFGYWQIYDATQLNQAILANKIAYVGGCFSTLTLMMCIFSICKVEIKKWQKLILYCITCFVYGTSLTVGYNQMFYKSTTLELLDGRYVLNKEYAFFHFVFYAMVIIYVIICFGVFVVGLRKKQEVSFKSVRLMVMVMVINVLSFFIGRALFDVELITASYVITAVIVQIITNRLVMYNIDEMVISSMMSTGEMGVAAFDFDYVFLGCNDIARKYYPQLTQLCVDKKIDKENESLKELLSWIDTLKKNKNFEIIYQQEEKYYKVSVQYLHDNNRIRGYNFIFTDFTEEKKHSEELIKVATKAKSDVLAQMSHEIRTPINAILGMNEMILRTTNEIDSRQYAEDVKRATASLLEIVNEILDFSKLDSGKMELVCMEYNLANLIRDVVNMFTIRAQDKNLKFIATIDESLPTGLYGDDVKIRQILANLLSNAVKYTIEGNVELEITGKVKEDHVILRFRVKDTGIGIKPENISKLFGEFERIEEKQNRGVEGTGLGMSITIRLLKMMNTTLSVDSVYGKGSEFYFDLEQQIVHTETIKEFQEKQKEHLNDASYQRAFAAPDAKILVVDDKLMNLKVFCSLLKETKMQIDAVESGQECLELVRTKRYDLIFLDHMMPEMDGVQTLHHMKELPDSKCRNTPVIVLTANAISGAREYYLTEGFDDFLSKPFQPENLERMILERLPKELICYETEENEKTLIKEPVTKESERKDAGQLKIMLSDTEGVDWNYALSHFNSEELLLEMFREFYDSMSYEADKLEKFYKELKDGLGSEKEDEWCRQYRIQVHSMKSSSNLVGITELSKMAKELEEAANEQKIEQILQSTTGFLQEWKKYRDLFLTFFEDEIEKPVKIQLDVTKMQTLLEDLKTALCDMDVDRMDENMQQISEFAVSDEIGEDIKMLRAFVTDLDEENAVPLIETLIEKIYADKG